MASKKKNNTGQGPEKQPVSQKDEVIKEPDPAEVFQAELEQAKNELSEKQAQLLSLAAEYDNFRKRSQKEREHIYGDVRDDVLKDLLPIVDNMERALEGDSSDTAGYKKGVEMTFAGLMALLEKSSIAAFGQEGDAFDPNLHNAVMHVEDETLGEQVVTEVFQKGYRHADKVLRPAMVKVAN